ncbi:hypothetical protein BC828DRAFT_375991 [Blastocladiella britannica]|nr:hypothetical protein BC828DRAFT_375991 [Blastocladiella britannica]
MSQGYALSSWLNFMPRCSFRCHLCCCEYNRNRDELLCYFTILALFLLISTAIGAAFAGQLPTMQAPAPQVIEPPRRSDLSGMAALRASRLHWFRAGDYSSGRGALFFGAIHSLWIAMYYRISMKAATCRDAFARPIQGRPSVEDAGGANGNAPSYDTEHADEFAEPIMERQPPIRMLPQRAGTTRHALA